MSKFDDENNDKNKEIESSSDEELKNENEIIDEQTEDALSLVEEDSETEDKSSEDVDFGDLLDNKNFDLEDESDENSDNFESTDENDIKIEEITEAQQKKYEKIGEVKEKISKILQAKNIEIVDENIGDEYETDESDSQKQQQQDYDSLKALFGDEDKNKKKELTLTIDDFDYTYVGQYVDEFDLMHVKNIKHIKLRRKHSKHFKKIIIAAAVVCVAAIAGIVTFLLLRTKPIVIQSVALNQTKNSYYINQDFEYTGLYFKVTYSDGTVRQIPLDSSYLTDIVGNYERQSDGKIKFTGGAQADLTFAYNGFNVYYQVEIKHKTLVGLDAIFADGLFNLKAGDIITNDYLELLCDYGSYGKEVLPFSSAVRIAVDEITLRYVSLSGGVSGYQVENDIQSNSEIEISYSDKSFIIRK